MKIALIASEFYPYLGGVAQNFNSLCKMFRQKPHTLYVFNKYYKSYNIFNVLNHLDNKFNRSKEILVFLVNKKLVYFFLKSIWTILRDKKTQLSYKFRMILYLLIKPDILIRTMKSLSILYPYFEKLNIDIIFGSSCGANITPLIFLLSRFFNNKVLAYAHGNEFLVRSRYSLKSFFTKMMDKIILSNKITKDLIKKVINIEDEQLRVIPYGLILEEYKVQETKAELRKDIGVSNDTIVLISVGRHVPRKKFDLVIKAVSKIKERNPEIKLKYFLIGEGSYTPSLKKLVNDLELDNEVEFLGSFGGLKRNKYLKLSDIFLMPSISLNESIEGFGIVFLEANFFKLPVIGASSGGIGSAIEHGKTGFLVKSNNLNDLVEKLLKLCKNEQIRIEMGEYGYNRVLSDYSWEKIYQKYIDLFNLELTDKH